MMTKFSSAALGLAGALALSVAAHAAPARSPVAPANEDVTGSIDTTTAAEEFHVSCHYGLARDGLNLQRGWFCVQDKKAQAGS